MIIKNISKEILIEKLNKNTDAINQKGMSYKIKTITPDSDDIIKSDIIFQIEYFNMGEHYWDFTKLHIKYPDGNEIQIINNYRTMACYMFKYNNQLYLFTQEDYQGFTIINLDTRKKFTYIPETALNGCGFCIVDIKSFNEDNIEFIVEGCYWGGDYEIYSIKVPLLGDDILYVDYEYIGEAD